jgi:hypothetical protein
MLPVEGATLPVGEYQALSQASPPFNDVWSCRSHDEETMVQQRLKLPGHKQLNGKTYLQAQLPLKLLQLVEQKSSRTAKKAVVDSGIRAISSRLGYPQLGRSSDDAKTFFL